MLTFFHSVFSSSWHLFAQAAPYMLFGLLVGGLLKVFLSPAYVATHLGSGRFSSVFKAALLGIPIPLCSCGVLPAAASLKKQGANNGATTAFLISTPESGVDSISITWALLDPIMTAARPLAAFVSAFVAGIAENLVNPPEAVEQVQPDFSCPLDSCCDGVGCPPELHRRHHSFFEKLRAGIRYAALDIWGDLAGWFFIGIFAAGIISTLVPEAVIERYLGGGLSSMLIMLVFGIPLYICATASTPIAAAFILKGVSPGAALVFLLVGPATNITSLSVLIGLLGKRASALYLVSVAVVAVISGLLVDLVYDFSGIAPKAAMGRAAEIMPDRLLLMAALLLLALSVVPLARIIRGWFGSGKAGCGCGEDSCTSGSLHEEIEEESDCGCGGSCRAAPPAIPLQSPDSLDRKRK